METVHASAPSVQPELPIDLVSEDDRAWWSDLTSRSAWWLDLLEDNVADDYGPIGDHDDDDYIIDRYIGNHGYEPEMHDELTRWGGHPG